MADIVLNNTTYQSVPAVDLPKSGGGTVRFWENALKMGVLRKDAELVQSWTKDSLVVHDDSVTLPAYSTSTTAIVPQQALSTVTLDLSTYSYFVIIRALTIPVYNTDTPAATRNEYALAAGAFELVHYPAGTFTSLVGSKSYATRSKTVVGSSDYRMLYWSSATAVSLLTSSTYGVKQVINAPQAGVSNETIIPQTPTLNMRGSSTYLSSDVYSTITDIRMQYIIELYRSPNGGMNLDGFNWFTQTKHIDDCIDSASHTLT